MGDLAEAPAGSVERRTALEPALAGPRAPAPDPTAGPDPVRPGPVRAVPVAAAAGFGALDPDATRRKLDRARRERRLRGLVRHAGLVAASMAAGALLAAALLRGDAATRHLDGLRLAVARAIAPELTALDPDRAAPGATGDGPTPVPAAAGIPALERDSGEAVLASLARSGALDATLGQLAALPAGNGAPAGAGSAGAPPSPGDAEAAILRMVADDPGLWRALALLDGMREAQGRALAAGGAASPDRAAAELGRAANALRRDTARLRAAVAAVGASLRAGAPPPDLAAGRGARFDAAALARLPPDDPEAGALREASGRAAAVERALAELARGL